MLRSSKWSLAQAIAREEQGRINSDDRNRVEFAFARSLGQATLFQSEELRQLARARGEDRPAVEGGEVDWKGVERQRVSTLAAEGIAPTVTSDLPPAEYGRTTAHVHFVKGNLGEVRAAWRAAPWEPAGPADLVMIGEALADGSDDAALFYSAKLRESQPAEADAIVARFLWSQKKYEECFLATSAAFRRYRNGPWPLSPVMQRLLAIAADLPSRDGRLTSPLFDLLTPAFSVSLLDEERLMARITVARSLGSFKLAEALRPMEPHFPWQRDLLELRARTYEETLDHRAAAARRELEAFLAHEPTPLSKALEVASTRGTGRVPAGLSPIF